MFPNKLLPLTQIAIMRICTNICMYHHYSLLLIQTENEGTFQFNICFYFFICILSDTFHYRNGFIYLTKYDIYIYNFLKISILEINLNLKKPAKGSFLTITES